MSKPISAFTRLSEAREKALFLAAQAERDRKAGRHPAHAPEPVASRPEEASLPIEPLALAAYPDDESPSKDLTEPAVMAGRDDQVHELPDCGDPATPAGRITSWADTVRYVRLALIIFAIGFYLVSEAIDWFSAPPPNDQPRRDGVSIRYTSPPGHYDRAQLARAQPIMSELFGQGHGLDWLRSVNSSFAGRLVSESDADYGGGSAAENARSYLRASIMQTRNRLDRDLSLQAARLYRTWLQEAQREGVGACRDVTGQSFFDGIPHLGVAELEQERAFARRWIEQGPALGIFRDSAEDPPTIPDWAMRRTADRTGLAPGEISAAIHSETDPRRCGVTVALIDALLERPEDAPLELLDRL